MWNNILQSIYLVLYIWALYRFFSGYKPYKYSLWWILLVVLVPFSAFVIYESYRGKQLRNTNASASQLRNATARCRFSIGFLVLGIAVVLIPSSYIYYRIMDGDHTELLHSIPQITSIGLLALGILYGIILQRLRESK